MLETNNPRIHEVLEEGSEFVAMVDPKDMESKILQLLEDEPSRQRIAQSGRDLALRDFRSGPFWEAIIDKLT